MTEKETVEFIKKEIENYIERKGLNEGINLKADYDSRLDEKTVRKVLDDKDPETSFGIEVDSLYENEGDDRLEELYREMRESLVTEETKDVWKMYDDDFWDLFNDKVVYYPPFEHYESEYYNCSIMIDTGDFNYDFSVNRFLGDESEMKAYLDGGFRKEYDKASGLWLAETQGYSKIHTVKEMLKRRTELLGKDSKENYKKNDFLITLGREALNTTTIRNVLTFLCSMSLTDLLGMEDTWKNEKRNDSFFVQVHKDTRCGFFDPCEGSGGGFNIRLEKGIQIPMDKIFKVQIEKADKHTPGDVYGFDDKAYTEAHAKFFFK